MKAVAYFRTSSATNVGGDSDLRQRDAVHAYASKNGYTIANEYYDAAVSGADPVLERPAFARMIDDMTQTSEALLTGPKVILIENASRFARDLVEQIVGHDMLVKFGITLIPVDAPEHFKEDTPTAVMVRHILGAVSQFEKDNLVSKLRKARERRRATDGKCEGRKSHKELHPDRVEEAKRLYRLKVSLRIIRDRFTERGWFNEHGTPYSTSSISAMLRQ